MVSKSIIEKLREIYQSLPKVELWLTRVMDG